MFKFLPFLLLVILLLGCTGPQGTQGIQGPQGERGDQGVQGVRGEQGERGLPGAQGAQGIQGIKGEQGEQGVQGRRGEQGERGLQGIPGEKGEQGEQGTPGAPGKGIELPVVFYTLDDLNRIAPRLEEELGGTWSTYETISGDWAAQLTSSDGYTRYLPDRGYWLVEAATADTAQHERLIAGFLRAIDPAAAAQRVAQRVVSNRASERSCQGPRMLELSTYQNDDGEWITFFNPVLSEFYGVYPAC